MLNYNPSVKRVGRVEGHWRGAVTLQGRSSGGEGGNQT